MSVLVFKQTTEKDLFPGKPVAYKDKDGQYTKRGYIKEIIYGEPRRMYTVYGSSGAYTADELKLIAQPKIKESNYWFIYDFAMGRRRIEMQGTKLQALYKLIQKRGEKIETEYKDLKGVMALEIKTGEWIAIKRTSVRDSFYPCTMKTFILTQL
jgi:hypothetical protein